MKPRCLVAAVVLLSVGIVACGGPQPTPTATPVLWYGLSQATDLSHLQSYHARYAFRWEGVKEGQQRVLTWDVLEERVREPPARRFLWTEGAADAEGGESEVELIQIGKEAYVNVGTGWMSVSSEEPDLIKGQTFLNAPLSMVAGTQARLVETGVTVNGVLADRYAFDESTLGPPVLGEVRKAKGQVWISRDLKVIVKYEGHYEGNYLAIGGGEEGVLDAAFDLLDINKPIVIQAPLGSKPAAPEDIPILDDAMAFTAVAGVVSYKTCKSVSEAMAFYEGQMPVHGWTKREGLGGGILTFGKGNRIAQIMIEAGEGKTLVMIMATQ